MPSAAPAGFAIHGPMDVTTEADLRTDLMTALDAPSGGEFVVDLSGVEAADMVGIGLLVAVHRHAGRRGRRLVLTGVPPRVLRLLTATRLRRVLTVREVPRVQSTQSAQSAPSEQPGARVVGAA